ncbi:hypothetical protein K6U06_12060 [Acidiferrimicrobium sp. IK]|uniref:hypothetical protein n=1 Tax=Acidiferrimicrobium sp. IK TaxID=2871700 RepID=UPI0021CB75EA|nr:hypothetical protein [Acidiferrimicrobium sp. IK]MCU4185099.1 hypothetical protein [Acidiferrimicrobium sp. IK]
MADPSPAPSAPADGTTRTPRPFDRSLLEATLADAARAAEAAGGVDADSDAAIFGREAADASSSGLGAPFSAPSQPAPIPPTPLPQPRSGSSALTPPPASGPTPAPRLPSPGAQALLSVATATVEDRAIDAGRLRVSGQFGSAPAGIGEVSLPAARTQPLAVASPLTPPAPPAVPAAAPSAAAPAPPAPAAQTAGRRPSPALRQPELPSAAAARPAAVPPQPAAPAAHPAIRSWQPSDDDILPASATRHRGRFRLTR